VQDCYHEKYGRVFRPTEIKMMLTAFSNMETIHIAAYSHLLDTIGMPEAEYSAFLSYKEMRDKHDYMASFGVENDADIARTLAMFGGFTEGVQLFASFAMLMNFPRFNKMKGMGQIVSWSVRDESLHCEGITRLFHAFCAERQCLTPSVRDDILDMCQKTIRLEDAFIDLAFEMGPVSGMSARDVKKYIRYIADWRLKQLGLKPIYLIDEHPLPWLQPLLNGVEHANFFETRATEYSKAATKGNWTEVWDTFDRRQAARTAPVANDPSDDPLDGGADLLGEVRAGE
jgi:ribonucleoside-diphosphate reductase beta chain